MTNSQINGLIFEVTEEGGGFVAECLTESIVTQADSWTSCEKMQKTLSEDTFLIRRFLVTFTFASVAMKSLS